MFQVHNCKVDIDSLCAHQLWADESLDSREELIQQQMHQLPPPDFSFWSLARGEESQVLQAAGT